MCSPSHAAVLLEPGLHRERRHSPAALALVLLCGSLAAAARGPLRVLVTNDDGVKAPSIDALVRAGLTAARLGIPAIAVSQGVGASITYADAAAYVGRLVERFRLSGGFRAKLTTRSGLRHALVVNVNFPTCTAGATRGIRIVPLGRSSQVTGYTLTGTNGATQTFAPAIAPMNALGSDCQSALANPTTDVEAMVNGFASVTPLNPDLTTSGNLGKFRFLLRR